MKNQFFIIPILVLSTWVSSIAKADTMLDGLWELDANSSITCTNDKIVNLAVRQAYLQKYKGFQLYFSALSGWKYWVTESGEQVTVPFHLEPMDKSGKKFVIKHPGTTLADIEIHLLNEVHYTRLEFRSVDTEWNMCEGGQYKVRYNYLRFNL